MKEVIEVKKARLELLRLHWERETGSLIIKLESKKNRKFKQLSNEIKLISNKVRDAVIDSYYSACRHKHAVVFFEWRFRL